MKNLILITAIFVLAACGNHAPKTQTVQTDEHQGHSLEVSLDNGKKWKVNFATNKGVKNMKALLEDINDQSELSAYRKLGAGVQKEFQHIFQRCDMTGEAHNQLHNYLMPMPAWFTELKEGDLAKCRSAADALNEHLEKFDTYFK